MGFARKVQCELMITCFVVSTVLSPVASMLCVSELFADNSVCPLDTGTIDGIRCSGLGSGMPHRMLPPNLACNRVS